MGYYTDWKADVKLSRVLTPEESLNFIDFTKDMESGWMIDNQIDYQSFHCYEDDSFKSYELYEELHKVLVWFDERGVKLNGTMVWFGEESGDAGTIYIVDNHEFPIQIMDPYLIVLHLQELGFTEAAEITKRFILNKNLQ